MNDVHAGLQAAHGNFVPLLVELFQRRAQWHSGSLLLGLAALLLLFLLQRWPRLPSTLVVLAVGVAGIPLLGAHAEGIALVGRIAITDVAPRIPLLPFDAWLHAAGIAAAAHS